MKQKIKWATGQIIVRTGTVQDDLDSQVLQNKIKTTFPDGTPGRWELWADLCVHSESSEGLPFSPALMRESPLTVQLEGYRAFLTLPRTITNRWIEAVRIVNAPQDVELAPVFEGTDPKA